MGIWAGNPPPPVGKSRLRWEGWGRLSKSCWPGVSTVFIRIIPGYQSSQTTQGDNLDP